MRLHCGIPADIDSWMDLVSAAAGDFPGMDLEEHRQTVLEFMHRGEAICVKEQDTIAGVMLFSGKHGMICCLAVAQNFRQKGAGSMLMQEALSKLDRTRPITVTTFRQDDPKGPAARALYQKFGFEPGRLLMEDHYPLQQFILNP